MYTQTIRTRTSRFFCFSAVMLSALLLCSGCPQASGSTGGGGTPPADKTYTVGGVNFTMKGIAAVTNKTIGHTGRPNNQPHPVSLSAYLIGETEVTQELWHAVMGNNPSFFDNTGNKDVVGTSYDTSPASGETQGKRPVEYVNWYQAIAFCNKLSKACNLDPCYTVTGVNFDTLNFSAIPTSADGDWNNAVCDWSKNGFRLPTEAEWEWAAMGGKDYKWAGTNTEGELVNYAWYNANSGNKTHEVKKKTANGYGLYDMIGNVAEWCCDWYDTLPNPLPADYPGAASGINRVMRGGNWGYDAGDAARAFRAYSFPDDNRNNNLGLRVACRP